VIDGALKPYLQRSAAAHAVLLLTALFVFPKSALKADKVYMIDFVGGTTLQSAGARETPTAAAAAAANPKLGPQTDPDSISTDRRRGPVALPRPSLLKGWTEPKPDEKPAASAGTATNAPASAPGPGGTAGASAGVSTDLPNFPYPWYISQIRLMLWQAWQRRMPRYPGEGVVVFSIMRNGAFTDLRLEESSGDSAFDSAALESVAAAAPFPALPSDFREQFLKIHLALRSE
jgi:TonB family protein